MTPWHNQFRVCLAGFAVPLLLLTSFVSAFSGESKNQRVDIRSNSDLYGVVGLDPWYTYNADTVNYPGDVNRALLERMVADLARIGSRWVRIEFHAEFDSPTGPGPIDYAKHDWFINELAPLYGINILAVFGSGMIGDRDPAWSFDHINEPLNESGSNRYIDLFVQRVEEVTERYGSRIAAVEILNEPNASTVLSENTDGVTKAVDPGNYGVLIRRVYEAINVASPETTVLVGGVLFDDENGASYGVSGRSFDQVWLEQVYSSRAVMSFYAERGRHPFDAVAVHPYFLTPPEVVRYLHTIRDLQLKFGDRRGRIWVTEIGLPAEPPDHAGSLAAALPSASERRQAAFLSAVFTTIRQQAPFVERLFWFKYEDFPVDNELSGWGLVRLERTEESYGTYSEPWPRKFAFMVFQALASPQDLPVVPVPRSRVSDGGMYFQDSGHTLSSPFLEYWRANGGSNRFGPPITEPFDQAGKTVQYFERARLEMDHSRPNPAVEVSQLGRYLMDLHGLADLPPSPQLPEGRVFPETGYSIAGVIGDFWESNGGIEQFGFPLTPEIVTDGRTSQYFERAILSYAPGSNDGWPEVAIEDVGVQAVEYPGWYR